MGSASWVANDLGLVVLTLIVLGLTAYLVYTMVHPERI
jgi:F subunit of K+-transporting ATPase (Potass_KdpF)